MKSVVWGTVVKLYDPAPVLIKMLIKLLKGNIPFEKNDVKPLKYVFWTNVIVNGATKDALLRGYGWKSGNGIQYQKLLKVVPMVHGKNVNNWLDAVHACISILMTFPDGGSL